MMNTNKNDEPVLMPGAKMQKQMQKNTFIKLLLECLSIINK